MSPVIRSTEMCRDVPSDRKLKHFVLGLLPHLNHSQAEVLDGFAYYSGAQVGLGIRKLKLESCWSLLVRHVEEMS